MRERGLETMKYMTQLSEVGASSQTCASVIFASLSLGEMSVFGESKYSEIISTCLGYFTASLFVLANILLILYMFSCFASSVVQPYVWTHAALCYKLIAMLCFVGGFFFCFKSWQFSPNGQLPACMHAYLRTCMHAGTYVRHCETSVLLKFMCWAVKNIFWTNVTLKLQNLCIYSIIHNSIII